MRISVGAKILILCLVSNILVAFETECQSFRFRNYTTGENLPSNVVYTVNQDNNGYLWIGTPEGISRFDGFEFFNVTFPDSAMGRYPTASMKDRNGTIWYGFNDGTVFCTDKSGLRQINIENVNTISAIVEGPDGLIYVFPQRQKIFSVNPSGQKEVQNYAPADGIMIFSACFTRSGNILAGTQENILVCNLNDASITVVDAVEGFDYARILSIHPVDNNDNFIIGTDGNGLFKLSLQAGSKLLERFENHPELETITVKSISEDSEKNLWVSTAESGVIKITLTGDRKEIGKIQFFDEESGLPGNNVTQVFQDAEGNHWIATNGNGLSVLVSDAFSFIAPGRNNNPNNIIFVKRLNGNLFIGTPTGYYIINDKAGKPPVFYDISARIGRTEAVSYQIDEENTVWIGTKGAGLFRINGKGIAELFYRSGDTGADYINNIKTDGPDIWLATLNGVRIIDKVRRTLRESYNINNGLPHNYITQLHLTGKGTAVIATESERIVRIRIGEGIITDEAVMQGSTLNKITAVTEDKNGVIWAATAGNGIFRCYADSVVSVTTANGIFSNYCYSIFADTESNIWAGHERGISRLDQKSGVIKTYSNDFAQWGACNADCVFEDSDGRIMIGTTRGLIVYDRSRDLKPGIPPFNNINSIVINNREYPFRENFSLPYRKNYSLKVKYVGISLSNPGRVFYSTYLENYDIDWSELSASREVSYSLRDGNYKFNLISVNEDGLTQETTSAFEIHIKPPVWRAWWFILSLIAITAAVVIFIVRQREKAQKKIQEYLEKELEARTRVVMEQKAEIELQNHEITDSINYAKRIQSSILPDINKLKEHFGDAFIIFHPRDIVSGDFYWFEKVDDDRFVLVCADSTGHGVPGAFMSMIGTTLLQDIVVRQRITKPSEILSILDKQIFSILNKNLDVGVSNDGMDIVVCEFTRGNRHLRFASAMRPVIILLNGETYYIKGNRASVGGESVSEKYFDDQEYYLNKGDLIYLFSDGLPDQFGGHEGKKMKIARLKSLINDHSHLDLGRQKEEIEKFYFAWKGDYEQVDDILLLGVRI